MRKISLPINEPQLNEPWQNLSGITSTTIYDDYNFEIASVSITNSWQTIPDYSIKSNSNGITKETNGQCRCDRDGHWLLLPSPSTFGGDISKVVTFYGNKRLSRDTILQQSEPTFPDSCESLTVSVDFHVLTDDLITDNDDMDEQNITIGTNKIQQDETNSSDETSVISR